MGLGGNTTALAVKVKMAACHTASLPVAVNCAVLGEPGRDGGGGMVTERVFSSNTPLGDEILHFHAGDRVELSGRVYTARDEAHLRMRNEGIPFDPKGAVIYHCGPVIKDKRIMAAGPTTSARMNTLSGFLLDRGSGG